MTLNRGRREGTVWEREGNKLETVSHVSVLTKVPVSHSLVFWGNLTTEKGNPCEELL